MKTITLIVCLLATRFHPVIAQQLDSIENKQIADSLILITRFSATIPVETASEKYLAKSKKQLSTGWTLLGTGTVAIGIGALIGLRRDADFGEAGTGLVLAGAGVLLSLGSIPAFVSSAVNKSKGKLSFHINRKQNLDLAGRNKPITSIGVSIPIILHK